MGSLPFITYGLDIEIDITCGSIDPATVPIRAIGLSTPRFERLFTGDEARMIEDLELQLQHLEPGVLATWNGSILDLPYIAHRAAVHDIPLGLTMVPDSRNARGRRPLPGHPGPYRSVWGRHRHLDTFLVYGDVTPASPWSALLGRRRRRGVIADTGDLLNEAMHAHAASDARLARCLAERKGVPALRSIDHLDPAERNHADGERARVSAPSRRLRPAPLGL